MRTLFWIRPVFTRQRHADDCGRACLEMILQYSGHAEGLAWLRQQPVAPGSGISLLGLKNWAAELGLAARCVRLEPVFLRAGKRPCILHVRNAEGDPHFLVCFGARKRGGGYTYLLGDPAGELCWHREEYLLLRWESRAALYFEDLRRVRWAFRRMSWVMLFRLCAVPRQLWISIPLLHLGAALLGVAVSWLLQKGMEDPLTANRAGLIRAVVLLLLVITLFRSLFNYVRQRLLIMLSASVQRRLAGRLISALLRNREQSDGGSPRVSGLAEIQKVQQAVGAFASVLLSDGSLVVLLLSGLGYSQPLTGGIGLVYLAGMAVLTGWQLPWLASRSAELSGLAARTESELLNVLQNPEQHGQTGEVHQANHERSLVLARRIAVRVSRIQLGYECLGTLTVISVLAYGLALLQQARIGYPAFMAEVIGMYLVTALVPRIAGAVYTVAEGAEAGRLNRDLLG